MQWFRLYQDVLDDPKVQRLDPVTFKHWINLLCLANAGNPRGVLPKSSDISFRLRLSRAKTERLLRDLFSAGLLDETPDGVVPHGWFERQKASDDITARTSRHKKERSRERSPEHHNPVQVNVLDTDTERETEQKEPPLVPPSAEPPQPKPKPPTRNHRIPEDWTAPENVIGMAASLGLTPSETDAELIKFKRHHQAKGTAYKRWDLAAINWLERSLEYKARAPTNGYHGPKGPDFAARVRELEAQGM